MQRLCWKCLLVLLIACACRNPLMARKLTKIEKLGQNCQEGNAKACAKLAEIATQKKHSYKRYLATQQITDQSLLGEIARHDADGGVRKAAVSKVIDQSVLAEVAQGDKDPEVRKAAVAKITDPTVLGGIAQHDADSDVCKAALSKVSNQSVLAVVAQGAKKPEVRKAAVAKLTDPAVLGEMARHDTDSDVRKAAVLKVTDQALLTAAALTDPDSEVREVATDKITDQAVLSRIADNQKLGFEERNEAIGRLTDQTVLAKIALGDSDADIRKAAVLQLKNQNVLAQVARSDKDKYVHWAALEKLTDQAVVAELRKAWRATHPEDVTFAATVDLERTFTSSRAIYPPDSNTYTASAGHQFALVHFTMSNETDRDQAVRSERIDLISPNGKIPDAVLIGFGTNNQVQLAGDALLTMGEEAEAGGRNKFSYVMHTESNGSSAEILWHIGPLADFSGTLVFSVPAALQKIQYEFVSGGKVSPADKSQKNGEDR